MKKILFGFVILVLGLSSTLALAEPPQSLGSVQNYTRVGGTDYGHVFNVPITNTSSVGFFFQNTQQALGYVNPTSLHLFKWGSMIRVDCVAAATFCWTMGIATISDVNGNMIDPYGSRGPGACFRVEANGSYRATILNSTFRRSTTIGRRTGFCSGNTTTVDWPCRANADCGSGGTCNTTCSSAGTPICSDSSKTPFDQIKGLFLQGVAGSATTCFVTEEI